MITNLEQISADSYAKRVKEEEEFMAMNIEFWKKAITKRDSIIATKDNIIVTKDSIIVALNAELAQINKELAQKNAELAQKNKELEEVEELEEYRCRYGEINDATN